MVIPILNNLSIGYIPYSASLTAPGDRCRFPYFAREIGLKYEIFDSKNIYDLVIASSLANPKHLLDLPKKTKVIFDCIDPYLAEKYFSIRGLFRGLVRYTKGASSSFYFDYKKAFIDILHRSDNVICSSPEQAKLIEPYCKNTSIILDAHFDDCFNLKKQFNVSNIINIEGPRFTLPER